MITGLQKSQKMENQTSPTAWTISRRLVRKLNINITGEHHTRGICIKYRIYSYKKMKKKKKRKISCLYLHLFVSDYIIPEERIEFINTY